VQKGKDMEIQNAEIVKEKTEAEAALEEALPALEAARAALDDLNKVTSRSRSNTALLLGLYTATATRFTTRSSN